MRKKYPIIDIKGTGENIKRIMEFKGLSVRQLQEYLELSTPQSIYHWFDGRNLPTLDNLYALSDLFGVPMDDLLIGNRKKQYQWENTYRCSRLVMYYQKMYELRVS